MGITFKQIENMNLCSEIEEIEKYFKEMGLEGADYQDVMQLIQNSSLPVEKKARWLKWMKDFCPNVIDKDLDEFEVVSFCTFNPLHGRHEKFDTFEEANARRYGILKEMMLQHIIQCVVSIELRVNDKTMLHPIPWKKDKK